VRNILVLEVPSEEYNRLDFLQVLKTQLASLFSEYECRTYKGTLSVFVELLGTIDINEMARDRARLDPMTRV
jgi:hypothetical protein